MLKNFPNDKAIKVKFKGDTYWLLKYYNNDGAPLAPLSHCNSEGDIIYPFLLSFAYVFPNKDIKQHGIVIGNLDDLEEVLE